MNYLQNSSFLALTILTLLTAVGNGPLALAQQQSEEPAVRAQILVDALPVDEVLAQDSSNIKTSEAVQNDKQSNQSVHSGERSSTTLSSSRGDELTLGDLRDSGIALNQVRQEAINIFLEATRTLCDKTTRSELIIPNAITEKDLELATKINAYQAPRPQWLFYYVGTIEPIISMLSQDVHNAKSGISKMLVPAGTLDDLRPLWQEWSTGITGINNELTDISKIVDSTQLDNAALAKHALTMYKMTETLERTRQKAFVIIRDASKHADSSEKVSLPGEK
ncbi:MAG TPA: hypothetical protein V6C81_01065 [Planktothrix sp.]|jgi:hypothetical protein